MDLVKIDGVVYDVIVSAIEEVPSVVEGANKGTALYKQREIRDIAGIKYNHKITFSPSDEAPEMFDALYSYLFDNVRDSVMLDVVHGQTTLKYEAAYSTGARRVAYIRDFTDPETEEEETYVGWDDLTVDFRSMETVVNPAGV